MSNNQPTPDAIQKALPILEARVQELRGMAHDNIKAGYMSDGEKQLDHATEVEKAIAGLKALLPQ